MAAGPGGAALGRAALVLLYYGFSIGITFYNKWLMKVRGGGAVRAGGSGVGRAAAVTAAVGPAELPVPAVGHAAAPAAHLRPGGAGPSPGALPLRAAAGSAVLGRLPPPGRPRRYGGHGGTERERDTSLGHKDMRRALRCWRASRGEPRGWLVMGVEGKRYESG